MGVSAERKRRGKGEKGGKRIGREKKGGEGGGCDGVAAHLTGGEEKEEEEATESQHTRHGGEEGHGG